MRHIIFALLFCFSSSWAMAQGSSGGKSAPLELADGAPDRYIVVPGDTLWGIAGKFLKSPYRWSELWKLNKDEIKRPQLIYPGQVLVLDKSGLQPRLVLETVVVKPHEYVEPLKKAISSIPPHAIEPFLTEPLIVDEGGLDSSARVVGIQDGRVMAGAGDKVYATNVKQTAKLWQLFRADAPLIDPDTKEVLGHEANFLGTAALTQEGDPSEFLLRSSKMEVVIGDFLLPAPRPDVLSYVPRAPERQINGRILGVKGGVRYSGRLGVISINRGQADGVENGHVFAVDLTGRTVDDRFKGEKQSFKLPDQRGGLIFVFRVFHRISYALVLESDKPLAIGDAFRTP
jgi:LysM repeat protein